MVFEIKDKEESLDILRYITEKDYTYIIGNTLDEAILTRDTIKELDCMLTLENNSLDNIIINEFFNCSEQEQEIMKKYVIERAVEDELQYENTYYYSIITGNVKYYLKKYFRDHLLQKLKED